MVHGILACVLAIGAPSDFGLRIDDGVAAPPATTPFLGEPSGPAVTVDVGAWIARLTGTARVGAAGTWFDLNTDLAVGDQMVGVAGEFAVLVERWRFGGIGFATSLDKQETAPKSGVFGTTAMATGDTLQGHLNCWMVGGEAGYTVWRPFADEPWPWSSAGDNRAQAERSIGRNGRPLVDAKFVVLAGGLALGYDQTLVNVSSGSRSQFDQTVGAIYGGGGAEFTVGMDGRVPLLEEVRVYAYAGYGPTIPDGNPVMMIRAGVAAMITPNVGVEFGYRLFDFDLTSGPSEIDGGIRGIFAAVSVKF